MERKRWTDDDVEKLKGMAQKYPAASIAAELKQLLAVEVILIPQQGCLTNGLPGLPGNNNSKRFGIIGD